MADAFGVGWAVLKGQDYTPDESGEDVVKQEDLFGFGEHFAGVSADKRLTDPKYKLLGRAGMSAAPRERGHEHHSFDWGLDEKGKKDAGFGVDDDTYHIDDIMEGSAQQVAARMLAPFDAEFVNPTFGAPCKSFSLAGETVGWKPNRDTMEYIWDIVHEGKDFPTVTDRNLKNPKKYELGTSFVSGRDDPNKASGRHSTPESIAMQNKKVKDYLNSLRGREGGWGFPVYEPRTIEELMFHEDDAHPLLRGRERHYGAAGPISEDRARAIRGRKESGLATVQRAVDIMREFERLRRMGFGFIENPKGQMRYIDAISHLPLTNISQASYSDPAQEEYMGLVSRPEYFDKGRYMQLTNPKTEQPLPPFKSTDLFGNLPPNMFIRPQMPRTLADVLYAKGERGSRSALQGMKGLPADALFPGSPPISAYHIKSSLPAYLSDDFTQAVEQYFGTEAPNEEFRGTNVNDLLRRKFAPKQTNLGRWLSEQ